MNTASNLSLQSAPRVFNGGYSGEYGGRKIKVCEYFPAILCKTSLFMKRRIIHDDGRLLWQLL